MIRGEIWLAALDPVRGSEQAGTRPVLVLQPDPLNAFLRTIVVVPFRPSMRRWDCSEKVETGTRQFTAADQRGCPGLWLPAATSPHAGNSER
ncbi:MAG: type II toxin-antitoxin system PemK/MazF family toxin [Acidobacteriia bacterium]|nr:type II toxin-antitoxin system PemK/MazF family toxin [Terriglobia bacterium]